ncbi:MAG TPA: toxin-antitoxin system HicB family antitoxin [Nostoc sp.]|uniref:toxin-antitoxin system HicB family antitoxin n=1 Tax=Nostoc sp. TaxID=1180 RepID=UPI002D6C46BE|nr:toxin-antitoxin system HicB family antitoxin [Nostoc sp.]HYX16626.1 toxin-antitoxin system HicB family antitoxin [Nostoc sp.]
MSCENRDTKIPDFFEKLGILSFTNDLGLLYSYSGILLRMPKSLHRRLAENSEQEGVSLNQYIVSLLSAIA